MNQLWAPVGQPHILALSCLSGFLVAWASLAGIELAATPRTADAVQASRGPQQASDVAVKAAYLYNFARFTDWPSLPTGAPIVACIVGDDGIAAAFVEIVGVRTVDGHRLVLGHPPDSTTWPSCQLLFIAEAQIRRSAVALAGITTLPVLTVSDTKGFAQTGGIIELFANAGQLRFAINVDAAERSGLRLSSKLLSLAKVI